jgi:HEAT repeat protein
MIAQENGERQGSFHMRPPRKRLLFGCGLALLLLPAAALLVPDWRAVVLGVLSGEPFYQGKPASWWARALREEKEDGPPVILSLGDPPGVTREFLHNDAGNAVPVLRVLLDDGDAYVRQRAAEALGRIRPPDDAVVSALTERLADESVPVRWQSAEALGRIGRRAAGALPALGAATRDEDEVLRLAAVRALGRVGTSAGDPVPFLVERLKDESELVRWEAAGALGRLGPEARAAMPALRAARKDQSPFVRKAAEAALELIDPEKAGAGREPGGEGKARPAGVEPAHPTKSPNLFGGKGF